jgi:hypothetical protein
VSKLADLSISLATALAMAPFVWTPLSAQEPPACTGPQAVELRSLDLATGTGRSAILRGTGPYAHCSWTTDATGRTTARLPLDALPTLDGSTADTCSLPVIGQPTEVSAETVIVEVLLVDPAPAVAGLVVWRGTARSVSRVPSWAEQVCVEARGRQMGEGGVSMESLPETGWGIPGLDEIEALVRAAPEVQALVASVTPQPATEALPAIVREDAFPVRQGARVILLDASDPTVDPSRHVHLIVREASPTVIEVAVDAAEQGEIRLRWVRSAEVPEWTPSSAI